MRVYINMFMYCAKTYHNVWACVCASECACVCVCVYVCV